MRYGQRPTISVEANALENQRRQVKARFAPDLHSAMHREAERRGVSASAYLAQLVAKDLGLPDPLAPDDAEGGFDFCQAS